MRTETVQAAAADLHRRHAHARVHGIMIFLRDNDCHVEYERLAEVRSDRGRRDEEGRQLNHRIIALTDRWGAHFGGINTFNVGFLKALAKKLRDADVEVLCVVERASDSEKQHASDCGIALVVCGANMLSTDASTVENVRKYVGSEVTTLWLGHDDKTGPLALAMRGSKSGDKAVLFNHMAHIAYQGFKKGSSQEADKKKEQQRILFLRADHVFCIGPRLHSELDDLLSTSPKRPSLTMLVPGFDELSEYAVSILEHQPNHFRGFAAGRLTREDDRVKQGRLAIHGFCSAVARDVDNGGHHALKDAPRVCLMGCEQSQEVDLRKKINVWGRQQVQLEALPFMEDREKYFRELASSSFAMMLSWHEGFGLTGWESISAGVPLILSKNSGLWKFIADHMGGFNSGKGIFPLSIQGNFAVDESDESHSDEDVRVVANAIVKIAALGEGAKNAVIALRDEIVKKGWTWERVVQDFLTHVNPIFSINSVISNPSSLPSSSPEFASNTARRGNGKFKDRGQGIDVPGGQLQTNPDPAQGSQSVSLGQIESKELNNTVAFHERIKGAFIESLNKSGKRLALALCEKFNKAGDTEAAVNSLWAEPRANQRIFVYRNVVAKTLESVEKIDRTELAELCACLRKQIGLLAMSAVDADWLARFRNASEQFVELSVFDPVIVDIVISASDDERVELTLSVSGSKVTGNRALNAEALESGDGAEDTLVDLVLVLWRQIYPEDTTLPDRASVRSRLKDYAARLATRMLSREEGKQALRYMLKDGSGNVFSGSELRQLFSELFKNVRVFMVGSTRTAMEDQEDPLLVVGGTLLAEIEMFIEKINIYDPPPAPRR